MYMNVIRNVICTLIILPIGLQAETSHSSMAKDTITVVATGNQNTVFETPSMVSVVTNDTPWSQNAVTSAGMLKGVAGLSQTGAGRTNGQTFNLRGYDKSGVLVLVDGIRQLSDMAKSSGTYLDPALVKRIEVVRGPNSSLYGSGGLGGVVDFRTADAADFLPPGETNGLSLWEISPVVTTAQARGSPGSVKPEKQMRSFLSLCVKEVISIKVMVSAHLTRKNLQPCLRKALSV